MRLHVGCGPDHRPEYINIDLQPCGDLVADASDLPFPDNSAGEVLALDVAEHMLDPDAALAEWARVLRPGGTLTLRVPNLHALSVQIAYWHDKPGPQLAAFVTNVYGGGKYGPDGMWDRHFTGWTPTSLRYVLDSHGFDTLSNDEDLNMTVTARKR